MATRNSSSELELKKLELANKYVKKLRRKYNDTRGLDILELLEFLSRMKEPWISSEGSYITDDQCIGNVYLAGDKAAVFQKQTKDMAADELVALIKRYRSLEKSGSEFFIELIRKELDEALDAYYGIDTYVYFIFDKVQNMIKIGRTIDIRKRLKALQTGTPNELKLLYITTARTKWEILMHKELKKCRAKGEWFKAEKEVFKFILWFRYIQERNGRVELVNRDRYNDDETYETELKELFEQSKLYEVNKNV